MSVSTISQSNALGADVLLMIFHQLEGGDLLNCETVCRQWRDILLAGTPWRRLFHRNIPCSPLWRKVQQKLEKNQLTLRTEQYREVCKAILQVERNWRTGQFKKSVYSAGSDSAVRITISDDYVAWDLNRNENGERFRGCAFLDPESKEFKEICLPFDLHCLNEMAVSIDHGSGKLEIVEPNNRWIVDVLDGEAVEISDDQQFEYGIKVLVEYRCEEDGGRIRIWKIGHPPMLLKDFTCEFGDFCVEKVDERFIVACKPDTKFETLYFISTETTEEFTSLSVMNCEWQYDRGLLFQYRGNGILRILDVDSGTHFNDVPMPFRKEDERIVGFFDTWASSNSKFLVIGWKYSEELSGMWSHLSVYDLDAIKKPKSNSDCCLLYTFKFQFDIEKFVMDENLIACNGCHTNGERYVTILNFANFGFL